MVNPSNDYIEWTFESCEASEYLLEITYALESGDRPLQLIVNSIVEVASWSFPATGSWSTWGTVSQHVTLSAGSNTIKVLAIGQSGGNIDKLKLSVTRALGES